MILKIKLILITSLFIAPLHAGSSSSKSLPDKAWTGTISILVRQHPDETFVMVNRKGSNKMKYTSVIKSNKNDIKKIVATNDDYIESDDSIDDYYSMKEDGEKQYQRNHHYKGSYLKTRQEKARIENILYKKNTPNPAQEGRVEKEEKKAEKSHIESVYNSLPQNSLPHKSVRSQDKQEITTISQQPLLTAQTLNSSSPIITSTIIVSALWGMLHK